MRYNVRGADMNTGIEFAVVFDADTLECARRFANAQGMAVREIQPAAASSIPRPFSPIEQKAPGFERSRGFLLTDAMVSDTFNDIRLSFVGVGPSRTWKTGAPMVTAS